MLLNPMGALSPGRPTLLLLASLTLAAAPSRGRAGQAGPGQAHDTPVRSSAPIPPSERTLRTVLARPWFKVSGRAFDLEGPSFDRSGNLVFSDVQGGRVLRLTPDRTLSTVATGEALGLLREKLNPGGIAIHKDGRIFVASVNVPQGRGSIVAVRPDGSAPETIVPSSAGFVPNDLVFDASGGLYFTDFRGSSTRPDGGAYYLPPDRSAIRPVLRPLAMANGVALSPDGTELWVTEFGRNLLHHARLDDATTLDVLGTGVAYQFTGPPPDSMRIDREGNLYVALYGQGRVMVFSRTGIPIGQILLPGRELGRNLHSTNLAIRPGTSEVYIVTSDADGQTIFQSHGFAKALPLYSHQ